LLHVLKQDKISQTKIYYFDKLLSILYYKANTLELEYKVLQDLMISCVYDEISNILYVE
jgi:hypothetical protein